MDAADATAGVLLVDKPAGPTSHDVVARVRRERRTRKVGHAGTLDPFATGLLVVLLGRATRLQRYLLGLPKTYRATARLGWTSTTGDPDGTLTETGRIPARLVLPTGRVRQRLPLTSAARVDGERLYKRAHRGERFDTPHRVVCVHRAVLLDTDGERAEFEITCSAGTYVRTLIETLGDAYCESLRRTRVGPLSVEDASDVPLDPIRALGFMAGAELDAAQAADVGHGRRIPAPPGRGPWRLSHEGRLVAVAERRAGEAQPVVVLG